MLYVDLFGQRLQVLLDLSQLNILSVVLRYGLAPAATLQLDGALVGTDQAATVGHARATI
jgi:hypothetical protein